MRVAGKGTNWGLKVVLLAISLALVVWGGWSLINGFPNFDALQAVAAPLPTAELEVPPDVAQATPTREIPPDVLPTATAVAPQPTRSADEPSGAAGTATAHAIETMLAEPSGGGGAPPPRPSPTEDDATGDPEPTEEGDGDPEPVGEADEPAPIRREAEFAYPQRMQVEKPATVRLTIFTESYNPLSAQNSAVVGADLSLPGVRRPGLTVQITADLDREGATIMAAPVDKTQVLSDLANKWEWQIVASERQEVQLRPVVRVEYVDETGTVQYRYEVPWTDIYIVTDVVDKGAAPVVGNWLGDNLVGLLSLVMGVPGTITTVLSMRKNDKSG